MKTWTSLTQFFNEVVGTTTPFFSDAEMGLTLEVGQAFKNESNNDLFAGSDAFNAGQFQLGQIVPEDLLAIHPDATLAGENAPDDWLIDDGLRDTVVVPEVPGAWTRGLRGWVSTGFPNRFAAGDPLSAPVRLQDVADDEEFWYTVIFALQDQTPDPILKSMLLSLNAKERARVSMRLQPTTSRFRLFKLDNPIVISRNTPVQIDLELVFSRLFDPATQRHPATIVPWGFTFSTFRRNNIKLTRVKPRPSPF